MNTNIKLNAMRRDCSLILLLALILMVSTAITVAADTHARHGADDGESPAFVYPQAQVTIAKKAVDKVITNIGDRYELSSETIIVGLDGQQVSIRKMLVPCEAEITYETKKGGRQALRIKIVRVGKDASWQYASGRPE